MSIYGILIGISVIIGIELIRRFNENITYKHVLFSLTLTLIGARVLYLMHNIGDNIVPYAVWDGGLAFYGALAGLILSLFLLSIYSKLSFLKLTDSVLLFLPLIQSIARIGNYFNNELYGYPTQLPWAIHIPQQNRLPGYQEYTHFHPVFLYESVLNILNFILLLYLWRNFNRKGLVTSIYLVNYSVIRLITNTFRIDKEYIWMFETSDMFSAIFLLIGIVVLIQVLRKR